MLAGSVDRRSLVPGARRPADDPGIDEVGPGRRNDFADADRGLRADRIAVEVDGFAVERCKRRREVPSERLGLAGLRPDKSVRTSAPLSRNLRPTPEPITPCAITAITAIVHLHQGHDPFQG